MPTSLRVLYGGLCYLAFQCAYLYLIGFLANLVVPKGIDGGDGASTLPAVLTDLSLVALFGLQHSVMARPGFKAWWTRLVSASLERSTYVLATSLVLGVVYWAWQPLPQQIWQLEHSVGRDVVWALFGLGNLLVLCSTFMIDHFDLFGLRQVYADWRGRVYQAPPFQVAWLYRVVRHPLYLGFFIVLWSTPDMTLGHLLFAAGMSLYILIGVRFEERDLVVAFGDVYTRYRESTPMILPRPGGGGCPFHGRAAREP